jgi:uroporphyrinogen decarboxylase
MPRETMTPRERWLAVLRREKPDRVPMDYWTTERGAVPS